MGLVGICPIGTFVETADVACIQSQTQTVLSAFFEAMHAMTVYMDRSPGPLTKALLEFKEESPSRIGAECLKALAAGPVQHEALPIRAAARQGGIIMAQMPRPPRISTGISFGLDQEPLSPKHRWLLMFHQGPLPLLKLSISDRVGFRPPPGWMEVLKASDAAHVLCDPKRCVGTADNLYLWLKRENIFPYSKGESSHEAAAAGRRLRQLCREILASEDATVAWPDRLSSWRWKQRRFIRKCDKTLLRQVGADRLSVLLKAMGTSPDEWFQVY